VGVFRALNGRFSHGAEKFEYFSGFSMEMWAQTWRHLKILNYIIKHEDFQKIWTQKN